MTEVKLRDVLSILRKKGYKVRSKRYRGSFYAYKLVNGLPEHTVRIDTFRGPKGSKLVSHIFQYKMKKQPSYKWGAHAGKVPIRGKSEYVRIKPKRRRR